MGSSTKDMRTHEDYPMAQRRPNDQLKSAKSSSQVTAQSANGNGGLKPWVWPNSLLAHGCRGWHHSFSRDNGMGIFDIRAMMILGVFPLKMVIFHSYVSLPEGSPWLCIAKKPRFFLGDARTEEHQFGLWKSDPVKAKYITWSNGRIKFTPSRGQGDDDDDLSICPKNGQ